MKTLKNTNYKIDSLGNVLVRRGILKQFKYSSGKYVYIKINGKKEKYYINEKEVIKNEIYDL